MNFSTAVLGVLLAQISIPGVPISIPVPSLPLPSLPSIPTQIPIPALVKERPVVEGAGELAQVPELDDFQPAAYRRLANLPRYGRSYALSAGSYQLMALSFCLNAGASGPNSTSPYRVATLGGARGATVQSVLDRWSAHPAISQSTVQELLWAITAKAKVGTGDTDVDRAARTLLTSGEISALNGGTLGVFTDLLSRLGGDVPEPLRSILGAQNQVRDLLEHGNASYQELASIAAPAAPEAVADGTRDRWSFDPQGYFVRYLPSHYSLTAVQVYVPSTYALVQDAGGRYASIRDAAGNAIAFSPAGATFERRVGDEYRRTRRVPIRLESADASDLTSIAHSTIEASRNMKSEDAIAARTFGSDLEAFAVCRAHGGCAGTSVAALMVADIGPSQSFDPTGNVGVPPSGGLQPIGTSDVPNAPPAGNASPTDPKNDKKSDCDIVKNAIERAKHFRDEYNDPALIAEAVKDHWSGQQFEDAITAKDAETATATGTAAGQVAATTDFETCQMTLPTAASFAAQGFPPVMYAATVAHEKQHQYDCFQNKKNHAGDTWATRRTSEINAYNDGIAIEQKWVDQNCN